MSRPQAAPKTVRVVNEGQRLLLATGASRGLIAAAAGISRTAAGHHRDGTKRPGSRVRTAYLEAFGIPRSAWDWRPQIINRASDEATNRTNV